jgi:hypothetical protein
MKPSRRESPADHVIAQSDPDQLSVADHAFLAGRNRGDRPIAIARSLPIPIARSRPIPIARSRPIPIARSRPIPIARSTLSANSAGFVDLVGAGFVDLARHAARICARASRRCAGLLRLGD